MAVLKGQLLIILSYMSLCGNGTFQDKENSDTETTKATVQDNTVGDTQTHMWAEWSPWLPVSDFCHMTKIEKKTPNHRNSPLLVFCELWNHITKFVGAVYIPK